MMTYEEAIYWLKYRHCVLCGDESCQDCKANEALRVGIEALDSQIPRKPIQLRCAYCEDKLFGYMNYCPNCGQAIDWSDEDEQREYGG